MAEYIIQEETLIGLADAVRAKSESTGELSPAQLIEKINALSIGIDTSDATAAAGDILSGKTAYVAGSKVTGTIATKTASSLTASGRTVTVPAGYYASKATKSISAATQATPSITVDEEGLITASATQSAGYVSSGTKSATKQLDVKTSSDLTASGKTVTVPAGYYTADATKSISTATQATPSITVSDAGLITASATQSAGYVSSGTKSATKQLTTQAAKTWTPTTSAQEIAAGTYLTGKQTIGAIPSNYIDTSDATAAASEILSGETAYVDGSKITGTMANNGAVSKTLNTSTTSYTVPAGYHSGTGKVSITTETKTATPSTSSQSITPSSGKVLSKVTVNAIPSNYIDTSDATATAGNILSGKTAYVDGEKITGTIATKTSSNVTASGKTVSIPAGYYASAVSKSVSTATQATPSISIDDDGLITASATQSAGYVSSGTKSATKQLDTETWVITYSNGSSTETVVVL